MHKIHHRSGSESVSYAEIENLGIVALSKLNEFVGIDILNYSTGDIRRFYLDIIVNPDKYKVFAAWLSVRFLMFIEYKTPMRIWIGGQEKFLNRGDEKLESSLNKTYAALAEYATNGNITSRKISAILYYVNKMVK